MELKQCLYSAFSPRDSQEAADTAVATPDFQDIQAKNRDVNLYAVPGLGAELMLRVGHLVAIGTGLLVHQGVASDGRRPPLGQVIEHEIIEGHYCAKQPSIPFHWQHEDREALANIARGPLLRPYTSSLS